MTASAHDRFHPIAALRAYRRAAVTGAFPEGEARARIQGHAASFAGLTGPAIRQELLYILSDAREPGRLRDLLGRMRDDGVLAYLLPEVDACFGVEQNGWHAHDVGTHLLEAADVAGGRRPLLRLALLLHDVGKPETRSVDEEGRVHFYHHEQVGASKARRIMERLHFDSQSTEFVVTCVARHMDLLRVTRPEADDVTLRRIARRLADTPVTVSDLYELRMADKRGAGLEENVPSQAWQEGIERVLRRWRKRRPPVRIGDLTVTRTEVALRMGVDADDRRVRDVLGEMLDLVIEDPSCNRREELLALAPPILPIDGHDVMDVLGLEEGGPVVGYVLGELRRYAVADPDLLARPGDLRALIPTLVRPEDFGCEARGRRAELLEELRVLGEELQASYERRLAMSKPHGPLGVRTAAF